MVATIGEGTGAASHDVRIDVDGVNGIGYGDADVVGDKELLEVARIALGTIANKDFVSRDVGTARLEVDTGDGFSQKVVAVVWPIATERGVSAHFLCGLRHRLDASLGECAGHVADTESNDGGIRMGLRKLADAPSDVGEKIGGLDF